MMNARIDETETIFRRMIIASLVFHGAIVLLFTIQTLIFPSQNIEFQPSIRVDLVALPEKRKDEPSVEAKEEVKKVEIPLPAAEAKVEKQKEVKVDTSKARTDALRKLKTMQALESLKKSKEPTAEPEKKIEQYKGNILSPGTSLRGLDKIQYDEYISSVQEQIFRNWNLPEWIKRLNLRAVAVVKIDKNGYVIDKTLLQQSGNAEFDRLVFAAIEMSSPFPPPPEKMQAIVGINGVGLGFPE